MLKTPLKHFRVKWAGGKRKCGPLAQRHGACCHCHSASGGAGKRPHVTERAPASRLRIQKLPPKPGLREAAARRPGWARVCGSAGPPSGQCPSLCQPVRHRHPPLHGRGPDAELLPSACSQHLPAQHGTRFSRRWPLLRYAFKVTKTQKTDDIEKKALGQHSK